jgi:hypothetical protein
MGTLRAFQKTLIDPAQRAHLLALLAVGAAGAGAQLAAAHSKSETERALERATSSES